MRSVFGVALLAMFGAMSVLAAEPAGPTVGESALPTPSTVKRVVAWDGEQATTGSGWTNPTTATINPQTVEAHSGNTALEFKFKGNDQWQGAGWSWCAFKTGNVGTDTGAMKNLVLWMKTKGKAVDLQINLLCNGDVLDTPEHHTEKVHVPKYCPQLFDGQWHEVVIPLADLVRPKGFDPKIVSQIHFGFMAGKDAEGSIFIDDIAFDDRVADKR